MPKTKKNPEEPTVTKQFILDHLDENEIDLSVCNLSRAPVKELAQVPRGTKLDLSQNQLTILPDSFCTLKHLVELDLSKNSLTELPANFGQLVLLQRLDLYSNGLSTLPLTFWQLKKLKWLDLKNNQLEPGLAEAAGLCLNEQECKDCAKKVLLFVKQMSSEADRRRQKELEKQRELERRQEEEKRKKREDAKKEKAQLRRRRHEEQERLEAERLAQEEGQAADGVHEEATQTVAVTASAPQRSPSRGGYCCWILVLVLLLALAVVIGLPFCDHLYNSSTAFEELQKQLHTHLSGVLGLKS